jgi:trehalose synthase
VTRVAVESLLPSSARAKRALDYFDDRATDGLAGRTVWCASALAGSRGVAHALRACLEWVGEAGVATQGLEVTAQAPLVRLAERLNEMLHGTATGGGVGLGAPEREISADGLTVSEALVGRSVGPGDVVVLHDPLTAMLAGAVRERGAHAVWYVEMSAGPPGAAVGEARLFLSEYTSAVDAYVMTWAGPVEHRLRVERIAALMPSADAIAAREVEAGDAGDRYHHVAWSSLLAHVVEGDRDETVGGTLHARPSVAAR